MTKKSSQKFKYLEIEQSFWDAIKSIFHHFWRDIERNKKKKKIGRWECEFKFTYFPSERTLEKQTKAMEDQGKKQIKAIENKF